jgi:hypothetical protein
MAAVPISATQPASPQSAGNAALDALFAGGAGEGQVAVQEAPPPPSDLGDHGKLGDLPPDGSPAAPAETDASGEATSTEAPAAEAKWLEFQVTDESGKRKMKVDLNNTEQLKRMLPQAAGFRKMQAERDRALADLKTSAPRLQELETNWQKLEQTYQEGGVEGLVDLLGGKAGHYKEWRDAEFSKHQKFLGATEAEKRAMAAEEQVARLTKQQELREKRVKDSETRAAADKEEAQLRSVEAQITPVFNKYRFAGTLGNAAQEAAFDQAVWDQALKTLEGLPEDQPLTNAQIDAEFRKVSTSFRAAIGKAGAKKAKEVIDNKKADAQTRVAAAVTRGTGSPGKGGVNERMAADIRRGGIGGLTDALMHTFRTNK